MSSTSLNYADPKPLFAQGRDANKMLLISEIFITREWKFMHWKIVHVVEKFFRE